MPRKVIVARLSRDELNELQIKFRTEGADWAYNKLKQEREELHAQKLRLDMDQTKAVTDLLRAAGENLSKAGYLIGKLNKDNSR